MRNDVLRNLVYYALRITHYLLICLRRRLISTPA